MGNITNVLMNLKGRHFSPNIVVPSPLGGAMHDIFNGLKIYDKRPENSKDDGRISQSLDTTVGGRLPSV
jgi:hypothetical protein